jgi:hypothetical protein
MLYTEQQSLAGCAVAVKGINRMELPSELGGETHALLARLRAFCFPGGEDGTRSVSAIRTRERGEMRASPSARWIPFTAEQVIEARRSSFRWEARYQGGRMGLISVTDAYEEGHGRLVVKLGGVIPVQKVQGPEADRGELQRYLASIVLCPPMVLNHGSLDWTAVGPLSLRVRDRADPTGATVDVDISEEGRPLACRADRPRMVGKQTVLTPWSGSCAEFKEWEGLRAATQLDVSWRLPDGPFTYYRSEVVSFKVVR